MELSLREKFQLENSELQQHSSFRVVIDPSLSQRKYFGLEKRRKFISGLDAEVELWLAANSSEYESMESPGIELPLLKDAINPKMAGNKVTDADEYCARVLAAKALDLQQNENKPHVRGIAHTVQQLKSGEFNKAVVPNSMLPEAVQKLQAEDIVSLLTGAELETFLYWIGRAIVGANNAKLTAASEAIEHHMRLAICLYSAPGSGKSTLMKSLNSAFSNLGFRVAGFNNLSGRFNHGQVLASDVAYNDDANVAQIKSLLTSELFKKAVTGGVMPVEDKGKDRYYTNATTCFAFCANDLDKQDMSYNLDAGVVDRIRFLDCEINPVEHQVARLKRLAKECCCSVDVLMYRLMRIAFDKFLSTYEADELQTTIQSLGRRLKITIYKGFTDSIISGMVYSYYLKNGEPPSLALSETLFNEMLIAYMGVFFDERNHRFRTAVKSNWEQTGREVTHPWEGLRNCLPATVVQAYQLAQVEIKAGKRIKDVVVSFFGSIYDRAGNAAANKFTMVYNIYQREVNNYPKYLKLIEETGNNEHVTPEAPEVRYILDSAYRPERLK